MLIPPLSSKHFTHIFIQTLNKRNHPRLTYSIDDVVVCSKQPLHEKVHESFQMIAVKRTWTILLNTEEYYFFEPSQTLTFDVKCMSYVYSIY